MMYEEVLLQVIPSDDGLSLMPAGEIDAATCPAFASAVEAMLVTLGEVVIDMSDVTFMDSAGLHVLRAAATRGPVRLRRVPAPVRRVIALTGLEETFGMRVGAPA